MTRLHHLLSRLAMVLLAFTAHAAPAERLPVTNLRPLLTQAVEHGSAQGTLTGEAARSLARQYGSREPILVDVKRVASTHGGQCARLSVTTHQKQVREQGKTRDRELTYEVSWCRDGRFPPWDTPR